ncbi:MAG: toxic anion resistance protein [Eubacteriales bacterium]|nr:toxic anion resistance protein [Eubacteriales bacterium]
MGEEWKDFEEGTPTLTLEPELELAESPAREERDSELEAAKKEMERTPLSPKEREMAEAFAEKIDIENVNQILQYGAGTQKKMADFSDAALENVKTQDLGEVGDLIASVVGELKDFDALEEENKGFFGFFKKQESRLETLKARYEKAEVSVEKITQSLEQHQMRLLKDSALLEKMYQQNLTYFKELTMYIYAGKKKLEQVRAGKLRELEQKAAESGLPQDAQAAKDLDSKCGRFEKKLHDLELTRMVSLQTAPQIRLVQNNDTTMVEKIQTTIVNTIPLWKSQMVLALGIAHSAQAAAAQRQVTDLTNELLKKNAQALHMASVETAKESERGVVDMETLKKTNADLIQTLDDVMRIQKEGRQKRQQAEAEMLRMENDLKKKLLEIQH